jgi:CBS domain-containing protein
MKVEQILDQKGTAVEAIARGSSLKDAVKVLGEKNIGAVVVTESDGTVCGILSERDVVKQLSAAGDTLLTGSIESVMTKNVYTCTCQDTVNDLMELMTEKRIRHLPVVEDGKLTGIVSIGDVVKRKIEETEVEAATLREYIAAG